ncbi:MAG: hypothetical protein AB8U25_02815 [Rickettsiales endosymbiont of Dermacentor nuttalli]
MTNIDNKFTASLNIQALKKCIQCQYFEIKLLILQIRSIEQNVKNFVDEYNKSIIGILKYNIDSNNTYSYPNYNLQNKLKEHNNILDNKLKSIYRN